MVREDWAPRARRRYARAVLWSYVHWLVGISILFVLLERLFPWRKGQALLRPGLVRDLGFLAVNGHFFSLLTAGLNGWLALAGHEAPAGGRPRL